MLGVFFRLLCIYLCIREIIAQACLYLFMYRADILVHLKCFVRLLIF